MLPAASGASAGSGAGQAVEPLVQVSRHVVDIGRAPVLAGHALPAIDLVDEIAPGMHHALVAPVRLRGVTGDAGGAVKKAAPLSVGRRFGLRGARRAAA